MQIQGHSYGQIKFSVWILGSEVVVALFFNNPLFSFHKLGQAFVNNAKFVVFDLCKSVQFDIPLMR